MRFLLLLGLAALVCSGLIFLDRTPSAPEATPQSGPAPTGADAVAPPAAPLGVAASPDVDERRAVVGAPAAGAVADTAPTRSITVAVTSTETWDPLDPVPGVPVAVALVGGAERVGVTDAAGQLEVTLPFASTVGAAARVDVTVSVESEGWQRWSTRSRVTFAPDSREASAHVKVRSVPGATLPLALVDHHGAPVESPRVTVYSAGGDRHFALVRRRDGHVVDLTTPMFEPGATVEFGHATGLSPRMAVDLGALASSGEPLRHRFADRPALAGRVFDAAGRPVAGARVTVCRVGYEPARRAEFARDGGRPWAAVTTDSEGEFVALGLQREAYEVDVSAGRVRASLGATVTPPQAGLELQVGRFVVDVTVVAPDGRPVDAHAVLDLGDFGEQVGNLPALATLARRAYGGIASGGIRPFGPDGVARFLVDEPGAYTASAAHGDYGRVRADVELGSEAPARTVQLALPVATDPAQLSVTVRGGEPSDYGQDVRVVIESAIDGAVLATGTSRWNQPASLTAPPGDVIVRSEQLHPSFSGSDAPMRTSFAPSATLLTLHSGGRRTLDVTLGEPGLLAVRSNLDREPGVRPPGEEMWIDGLDVGCRLRLAPVGGGAAFPVEFDLGTGLVMTHQYLPSTERMVAISTFPPGDYMLEATLPGHTCEPVPVTIEAGATAEAALTFVPVDGGAED